MKIDLESECCITLEPLELGGLTVPEGFESDGITTPRLMWLFHHPFSKYFKSALVHDYALTIMSRSAARKHFQLALRQQGASPQTVFILSNGVKINDIYQTRLHNTP